MSKPVLEDMSTRRKHQRVSCHWNGRLQNTQRQVARVSVRNISLGGVGLQTQMCLKKGDKVLLEFRGIHNGNRCEMRAICLVAFVVVRGNEYDVGLQFSSAIDSFRDFLTKYINGRTVGE